MTKTTRRGHPAALAQVEERKAVLPRHGHAVQVVVEDGLKIIFFRRGEPWKLAELMPMVESCGLVALTEVTREPENPRDPMWRHEVLCELPAPKPGAEQLGALRAVLGAMLDGACEQDSLNRLSLLVGLGPKEITVWRAWVAYLQQLDARLGTWQVRRIIRARPDLAKAVWQIFACTHDPVVNEKKAKGVIEELRGFFDRELATMTDGGSERVWRMVLSVVEATLRTNVWQVEDVQEALAFKLECRKVVGMSGARPWREILVYASDVEGVHLRGGPIARGGLRHSDRETDYRTEVLGLMVTQMRKNTIIVPVGAKGGFLVKAGRERAVVERCYRKYVRALLSVTDTYGSGGKVLRPKRVVCLDGADPYLVVAADKGTAKLSDAANDEAVKADYWGQKKAGFWLGDAFASGGAKGYDHKVMAITARGAWISAMHHAGALGILPTAARPLVMVGIGDMGGDVFGNGLLRDKHVQLVAAFNHAHIFIDPNPDPAVSFAERQRMFAAGLGWDGYDRKKISSGGGVWVRGTKSVELSEEAQARLGLRVKSASPNEVIAAILRAQVDCVWNGGIGTYVKAHDESHAAVADKANDDVRVDGCEVRAKMFVEGGNLGVTPKGRVEMALRGVRLNTDALDNSAGVNCSDYEVNIKILLDVVRREEGLDEAARVKILKAMQDEVATLVLEENTLQNQLVTLEGDEGEAYARELLAWQQELVKKGFLDPHIDQLPGAKVLAAREGHAYTRPELCALVAGTKAWLRTEILQDKELLDSEVVKPLLGQYFPSILTGKFGKLLEKHPLAGGIKATMLTNLLVDRLGVLGVVRLCEDFDASAQDAARACTVACGVARLLPVWRQADGLKAAHATKVRIAQRLRLVAAMIGAWILKHGQPVPVSKWLKRLHGPCAEILALLPHMLTARPEMERWQKEWLALDVPEALAARLAVLSPLVVAPDVVVAAENTRKPLAKVLLCHLQMGEMLKLPAVVKKMRGMAMPDRWARQAVMALMQEIFLRQRKLTEKVVKGERKIEPNDPQLARYEELVREMVRERELNVAMLSVLVGRLRELES